MKKIISLILVAVIFISFSGCDLYKGKDRIVAITYENEIFNAVQNQECLAGLRLMQSKFNLSYRENLIGEEFEEKLDLIASTGVKLIWCFEPQSKDALLRVAEKYKKKDLRFGIMDATYDEIPSNIATITFREHEGAFLGGYIAAKTAQGNILGFLGGEENAISKKYEYGYKAGILYASKLLNKEFNVVTLYTGDDYSKESGREGAKKLYNESGCEIIFQASQVTGLGAIEMAVELDKLIIGNGTDQSAYGPKNVLTSVVKNVKNAINRVSTLYTEEEEIGGRNFDYGVKDRIVGIAKTTTNMDKTIYKEAKALRESIANGEISVPHNEETYQAYLMNNQ